MKTKKEEAQEIKRKNKSFTKDILFLSIIMVMIIVINDEVRGRLTVLVYDKVTMISMSIIIIFIGTVLNMEESEETKKYIKDLYKLKYATKHAFIGFVIALMAYLDMVIAPFWIALISGYYLDIDV